MAGKVMPKTALVAGARERRPVMDQFYGDRSGQRARSLFAQKT